MRSIALPELLTIASVALFWALILVLPFWKIFSKAGYSGALSIAMAFPFINLVMLFFLAFSEWPALRELNALRALRGQAPGPQLS